MNPAKIDLQANYFAPIGSTAMNPRIGGSGAGASVFASPIPMRVGRVLDRSQISSSNTAGTSRTTTSVVFLARYLSTLSEWGRLVVEGRTYDIISVIPVAGERRKSWVHIACNYVKGVSQETNPKQAFTG